MDRFLKQWDAFICPVTATQAFKHFKPKAYFKYLPIYHQKLPIDGKAVNYWVANGSFTTIFNLTGNPVVTMPIGFTEKKLPVAVQIVGRNWEDERVLEVAEMLQKIIAEQKSPPDIRPAIRGFTSP